MSMDWLKPAVVLGSVLYAVIGVVVLWVSFAVIDKLTPYKLWDQIVEHKNVALAIVVAGMFIAIGQIVAAAIHG
jgi:putative membrane protein